MSLFDSIASRVSAAVTSRAPSLSAVGQSVAGALVGRFAPSGLAAPLSRVLRGDIVGAGSDALTGFAAGRIAGSLKVNPLLGGVTLDEAARIGAEIQATNYARKNLWHIEIGSVYPGSDAEGVSHAFNLFATDVSYTPWSITSEAKPIGMTSIDTVTGSERVEIRVTTYDDTQGTIKRWFDAQCAKVAHKDGTVGLPAEFLFKITITQAATNPSGGALFGSYGETYKVRASSTDTELARGENGLQQIQMVFTEFDPFM